MISLICESKTAQMNLSTKQTCGGQGGGEWGREGLGVWD